MDDCIFCKIARGEIKTERVYENDNFLSIFDNAPYTEGHALVISKKHFNNILDIPRSLGSELLDAIKNTSIELMSRFKADGFNVVFNTFEAAGQAVFHIHAHILPRKKQDDFKIFVK